jgi:hypothetical protein
MHIVCVTVCYQHPARAHNISTYPARAHNIVLKGFYFSIIPHIHSVHEFADVRVYGGENVPNIFAVLYASSMTMTLTTE